MTDVKPDDMIHVSMMFGHVRLEDRSVFDGGRMHFESRRIDYDERGNKTVGEWSRTGVSIGWDDGSPLTAKSLAEIMA
jgi:hypothetical protein